MSDIRIKRVESTVKEEISMLIIRGMIKDPRISKLISITDVEISKDISHGKVYVSSFDGALNLSDVVDGLNNAAGFIQRKLGKKLHSRHTPKLVFYPDKSIKEGIRMTRRLEGLNS